MKKKLCFMMLIAVSISISAQLKVESTGKVAIQRTTQNNKSSLCVGDLGYSTFDYGNFSVGVESQGYTSSASSTAVGVSGEASNVNTTQNSSMAIVSATMTRRQSVDIGSECQSLSIGGGRLPKSHTAIAAHTLMELGGSQLGEFE